MSKLATVWVRKELAQRLKRLKRETSFIPNYLLFAKLINPLTDEELKDIINEVHKERDLVKYNYRPPDTNDTSEI